MRNTHGLMSYLRVVDYYYIPVGMYTLAHVPYKEQMEPAKWVWEHVTHI